MTRKLRIAEHGSYRQAKGSTDQQARRAIS